MAKNLQINNVILSLVGLLCIALDHTSRSFKAMQCVIFSVVCSTMVFYFLGCIYAVNYYCYLLPPLLSAVKHFYGLE